MATVLKKATDELRAPSEDAVASFLFNMDSTAQIDIPEVPPATVPIPERIIVRRLDFISGPAGPIGYLNPDRAHPCSSFAEVTQMIATIRNGSYNPQEDATLYFRPLDLNLSVPTCFIIRLSNNWNWRFNHKTKGATLGSVVGTAKDNYYNLRHVLNDNVGQPNEFAHSEFCRLIYFFAKPVPRQLPTDPQPPFYHPFNLNIELVYPDLDIVPNTIPIVIDPDIRYPGGSQ